MKQKYIRCNEAKIHKNKYDAIKQKYTKINAIKQYYGLSQLMLLWLKWFSKSKICVHRNVCKMCEQSCRKIKLWLSQYSALSSCHSVLLSRPPSSPPLEQNDPACHSSAGLPPSFGSGSLLQSVCTLPCCRTSPRPS